MEAKELEVEPLRESWNFYKVKKDNTILKIKLVLVRLFQEETTNPDGSPMIGFLVSPVIGAIPDTQSRGQIPKTAENNLDFEKISDEGSEYKILTDGTIISFVPHIAQIRRDGTLDMHGDPMYSAQVQPLATFKKPN